MATRVNGAPVATFARDLDGLVSSTGELQIARDAASGDITSTTLGSVTTERQTSAQGELESEAAAYAG